LIRSVEVFKSFQVFHSVYIKCGAYNLRNLEKTSSSDKIYQYIIESKQKNISFDFFGVNIQNLYLRSSLNSRYLSTFLLSLHQEFQDLSSKLLKVSDLILVYGGELTEKDTDHLPPTLKDTSDNTIGNSHTKPIIVPVVNGRANIDSLQQSKEIQQNTITNSNPKLPFKTVVNNLNPIQTGFDYPQQGTWKDKIIYALRIGGRPILAKDIATFIQRFEPPENAERVASSVRQYTSNLSKTGHIGVDNSSHAHKYFLIS
jgi:hypothetical protein